MVAWVTFTLPKGASDAAAKLEACRCAVHFVDLHSKVTRRAEQILLGVGYPLLELIV